MSNDEAMSILQKAQLYTRSSRLLKKNLARFLWNNSVASQC